MSGLPSPQPEKASSAARRLLLTPVTARRAAGIIAAFTTLVTLLGGVLEWLFDQREFPTLGKGLWFALQTVTTVGYGDATPEQSGGRFIAAVVMLSGIGFLAVISASVTAELVESNRRRVAARAGTATDKQLKEISDRLARIEAALERPPIDPADRSAGAG